MSLTIRQALSRRMMLLICVGVGLLVCVLVIYPLVRLIIGVFDQQGNGSSLVPPGLVQTLWDTLIYVVLSSGIALVFGGVLAWIHERTDARLGRVTALVATMPLLLPPLAGAIGWSLLGAQRAGIIDALLGRLTGATGGIDLINLHSFAGMVFVTALYMVPYSYLMIAAALRNVDGSLEEAARVSGSGVWRSLGRVTIPVLRPTVFAAFVLIAMSAITEVSVPIVLGQEHILSYVIYSLIEVNFPPDLRGALFVSLVAVVAIQALVVSQYLLKAEKYRSRGARGAGAGVVKLGVWRRPLQALTIVYLFVAAVMPLLAILLGALEPYFNATPALSTLGFQNFRALFSYGIVVRSLVDSVILSAAAALITVAAATVISYYLYAHRNWLSRVMDNVTALPATVPHIALGVAFLVGFSHAPFALYGSIWLLLLAYIPIFMPRAMQATKQAFGQVSPELFEASLVSGKSEAKSFLRILVPLILPSVASGVLIVAVLASSEVNASVILASASTPVVGPTLLTLFGEGTTGTVCSLAIVMCAVNGCISLAALWMGSLSTRRLAR